MSHSASDVGSLLVSTLISAYIIWCIWSLHEALMQGGKAAEDVGFSVDQVPKPSACAPPPPPPLTRTAGGEQAGEFSPLREKSDGKKGEHDA